MEDYRQWEDDLETLLEVVGTETVVDDGDHRYCKWWAWP